MLEFCPQMHQYPLLSAGESYLLEPLLSRPYQCQLNIRLCRIVREWEITIAGGINPHCRVNTRKAPPVPPFLPPAGCGMPEWETEERTSPLAGPYQHVRYSLQTQSGPVAILYLPTNRIPTRSYSVCEVAANSPTIYTELQHSEAEQRSLTQEIDEIYEYDFSHTQMKAANSAAICSIRIFIACRCSWKYMRIPWGSQILEGIIVHLEICSAKCGICFLLLFAVHSFLVTMHYSWLYL